MKFAGLSFTVRAADDGLTPTAAGMGDSFYLNFDEDTVGFADKIGKEAVDSVLAMSVPFSSDYTAIWFNPAELYVASNPDEPINPNFNLSGLTQITILPAFNLRPASDPDSAPFTGSANLTLGGFYDSKRVCGHSATVRCVTHSPLVLYLCCRPVQLFH